MIGLKGENKGDWSSLWNEITDTHRECKWEESREEKKQHENNEEMQKIESKQTEKKMEKTTGTENQVVTQKKNV